MSGIFLKLIILAGWALFAFDAVLAIVAIVARNMGDDAASRGMAVSFGLVALVPVLIGGTVLYFSMRAHSWLGVIGSVVPGDHSDQASGRSRRLARRGSAGCPGNSRRHGGCESGGEAPQSGGS